MRQVVIEFVGQWCRRDVLKLVLRELDEACEDNLMTKTAESFVDGWTRHVGFRTWCASTGSSLLPKPVIVLRKVTRLPGGKVMRLDPRCSTLLGRRASL